MKIISPEQVRLFLLDHYTEKIALQNIDAAGLNDDFDLLDCGIIDSLGVVQLFALIREKYDIQIEFDKLDPDECTSIGYLSKFVAEQCGRH